MGDYLDRIERTAQALKTAAEAIAIMSATRTWPEVQDAFKEKALDLLKLINVK